MSLSMHVPTPPHHNPNVPGDPAQPEMPPEIPPQEPPMSPPEEPPTLPPHEPPIRPPGGEQPSRPEIDLPPAQEPVRQQA